MNSTFREEINMGLKEENLRLKLALLDMVRQFYDCILTPKRA